MNIKLVVNNSKCVGCGLCVKDCVGNDIKLVDNKAVFSGKSCIKCGHCEAICPNNAVHFEGFEDDVMEYENQVCLDPDTLMGAIKTRRTIRQFKDEEVSDDVLNMIIEAGRLAPTGGNGQHTKYVVLKHSMSECEKIAVSLFQTVLKPATAFLPALKEMGIDDHFFFKKAPLVIVIFGNDKVSASLAAQNMAFMAEANHLGVLFSGFFTTCVNFSSKLRKVMGVSKNPKAVTTLVIGHPAVKYHRTTHRNKADVVIK